MAKIGLILVFGKGASLWAFWVRSDEKSVKSCIKKI